MKIKVEGNAQKEMLQMIMVMLHDADFDVSSISLVDNIIVIAEPEQKEDGDDDFETHMKFETRQGNFV